MTHAIGAQDLPYLLNESRDCPQHVAGVLVFDRPPGRRTVAELVERYRSATPVAPFDLVPELAVLGRPRWAQVREFDMRYHVQHVALPAPGSDAQLDLLVQQWHSELIDRHRPLFQIVFVEGLAEGRFAIFAKVHHSIVDGASAIARLLASLSEDPAAAIRPPLFAVDLGRPPRPRGPAGLPAQVAAAVGAVKKQALAAGELTGEFLGKLASRALGAPSQGSNPFEAPLTPLNGPVRYGRAFAHLTLPIAPLRAAAKRRDGTLNDAVLAIVDDAVARYLGERGYVQERPLHAMVPVSLREAGSTDAGSMVSAVICPLGEPGAGVHARLLQTIERMNAAKARIRGFSKTAASDYYVGLFFLAIALDAAGVRQPAANFVVSNVPGTPGEVYLGGARLAGVYPMNVLAARLGLTVTLVSRAGALDIGFTSNRSVLPDPGTIAACCRDAYDALCEPRAGRAPAAKRARAARTGGRKR